MTWRTTIIGALLLAGCGDSGSYELSWTVGCDKPGDPACAITSVRQCTAAGLDTVLVEAGAQAVRTIFACFAEPDGALGRGPGLAAGPTELKVSGLSANGTPITGPITVTVEIPAEGFVPAGADLPLPIACNDGVDNDGDGRVDGLDPGCEDMTDPDER